MEKKKRFVYSDEERAILREAVLKRRMVVENKKTDASTVVQKNACWDEIAEEFNSHPTVAKKTVTQLKKLWDNIKFRRKEELGNEKRERLKIGSGSWSPVAPEDPEMDILEVEIKVRDALDSDCVALQGTNMLGRGMLVPTRADELITVTEEPSKVEGARPRSDIRQTSTTPTCEPTPRIGLRRKRLAVEESEDQMRRRRNLKFIENDDLHNLMVKEYELKIKHAEVQLQATINEQAEKQQRNAELHALSKKNLELEILRKEQQLLLDRELFELKKKEMLANLEKIS